mmetsp:Transcript_5536/g.13604  ORF Transcript_5536/g.13604 Transcript_5536/m.13604 type:complete len:104 (+) Transcript_5536:454-765(+)
MSTNSPQESQVYPGFLAWQRSRAFFRWPLVMTCDAHLVVTPFIQHCLGHIFPNESCCIVCSPYERGDLLRRSRSMLNKSLSSLSSCSCLRGNVIPEQLALSLQ